MPSLDTPCNLAYVKNVSTTDFFTIKLTFSQDLFDRIRLGVSRISVRDKSAVFNVCNYHLFVVSSANNQKIASFTVYMAYREIACRTMSSMQVTRFKRKPLEVSYTVLV